VVSTSPTPPASTILAYGQYVFLRLAVASQSVVNDYNTAGLKVCLSILSSTSDYDEALALGDVYAWVTNDVIDAREFLDDNT